MTGDSVATVAATRVPALWTAPSARGPRKSSALLSKRTCLRVVARSRVIVHVACCELWAGGDNHALVRFWRGNVRGDGRNFSNCTAECGGGFMSRERAVVRPEQNGGLACPSLSQTVQCNLDACFPVSFSTAKPRTAQRSTA